MIDQRLQDLKQTLKAAKRLDAVLRAKNDILQMLKLSMPDSRDPEDADKSRYAVTPLARLLAQIIEKVRKKELKRVAVSVGPQFGKSQILSRVAPAYLSGNNPLMNIILGSYNQPFADQFGGEVQTIIKSSWFQQIFPEYGELRKAQAGYMVTRAGGQLAFVGVGGSGTGKPADLFIVDDPIKSAEEANSALYRETLWKWFTSVAFTRGHDDTAYIVVQTRWHEDDLIGRLCDPDHPERNKKYAGIAEDWTYINLPAVVTDPALAEALGLTLLVPQDEKVRKQFGVAPMSSLWPGRKSLPLLAEAKRMDARTFSALYMGKPSPEDGEYFKAEDLVLYHSLADLPKSLRKYGASDHAVSKKQEADPTVLGCVAVDDADDIWVLPDIVWRKMETDATVEALLEQFKCHHPQLWWMESELISKSFGPFLKKRMMEERVYTTLDPVTPAVDKSTRARSVQGRMRMKKVHFPAFAPWWPDARNQLLKFPYGTHDDFVDFLAHIGMGLEKIVAAPGEKPETGKVIQTGSPAWILAQSKLKMLRQQRVAANAGW
jgi:predicted phage terminase large subunit-like protein